MVLQVCVPQMCLWGVCSPELLFKSIICGSLMRGTCSAQSIFLHGPPAPTHQVQINPHRQIGSICSGSPAMDHRHPAGRMQNRPRCLSECFFFSVSSSCLLPFCLYTPSPLIPHWLFESTLQSAARGLISLLGCGGLFLSLRAGCSYKPTGKP